MTGIDIIETDDLEALIPFFIENGLEFSEYDEVDPDEIIKCWRAECNDRLVGGCVLARREGHLICDGIATDPQVRGHNIGKALLDLLIQEAIVIGGREIFLVARAPWFFAKYGFEIIARTDAPDFFECFSCPQYGRDCHPEVMRRAI